MPAWQEVSDAVEYDGGLVTQLLNVPAIGVSEKLDGAQYVELKITSMGDSMRVGITDSRQVKSHLEYCIELDHADGMDIGGGDHRALGPQLTRRRGRGGCEAADGVRASRIDVVV